MNANKSSFCTKEIGYLAYILTRGGKKHNPRKLRRYSREKHPRVSRTSVGFWPRSITTRDLWAKRNEMLTPLTLLVRECGHTKTTKKEVYSETLALG